MADTHARQLAQYKFRRAELDSPTKPAYYSLLENRGGNYYLAGKQVIFAEDAREFIINYYDDIGNPAALRESLALYRAIAAMYAGISKRDMAYCGISNHANYSGPRRVCQCPAL